MSNLRVIIHLDIDCFYAQVEAKRLSIAREEPLAVQQWQGLIAVNYAARAAGVTRHMRVAEALNLCPSLNLVHVETLGDAASTPLAPSEVQKGSGSATCEGFSHRLTQKACLERYRKASFEILKLTHKVLPQAIVQKASIDEVYLDVTHIVDQEVKSLDYNNDGAFAWGSVVLSGPLDEESEFDRRLACGAKIACRLRGSILSELAFTSSAGISSNKLLSKIASALHKPNQQTVVPTRAVGDLMQGLPLRKIGGLGGKLGKVLEDELNCGSAGDVHQLANGVLAQYFPPYTVKWIEQTVQGISNEPVEEIEKPKSMLAAKSFDATSDLRALRQWVDILARELVSRMLNDEAQYNRKVKTLTLHYKGLHNPSGRSRSGPMPKHSTSSITPEVLSSIAWDLFQKSMHDALPCTRLAIAGADFYDIAPANESIRKFMDRTVDFPPAQDADQSSEPKKEKVDDEPLTSNSALIIEQKRIMKEVELLNAMRKRAKQSNPKDNSCSKRYKSKGIQSFLT